MENLKKNKVELSTISVLTNKDLVYQDSISRNETVCLIQNNQSQNVTRISSRIGSWEFEIKNNKLTWSDVVYQIYELEMNFQPTLETAISFYAPESKIIISEAVRKAIEEGVSFDFDLELITAKNNRFWVRAIGQSFSEDGKIIKIGGLFKDINERKQREYELKIANEELDIQTLEKQKRESELMIVNKAFLQSEENFRRSISESPLGIRIVTVNGKTIYVNKAFLEIYELKSLEEYKRKPASQRYTSASYTQHLKRREIRKNNQDVLNYEKSLYLENNEIRHVKVWRKEVQWNGIKHFQVTILDITDQKKTEEALKKSQQELRKFATHLQNIREEEKKGLAREIHDDLGQMLVALKIDLGLFKNKVSNGIENICTEEIQSKFEHLTNMVDDTIKTTRRIMTGLRPEMIDLLGFVDTCKNYISEFQKRRCIHCKFESMISELNISPQQSVALFRILQEALTNIAKHAKATKVKILLGNKDNKIIMEIVDNGVGFDKDKNFRQDSYGMLGMKERVFLLEGELIITSKIGSGTSVKVIMPYKNQPL